MQPAEYYQAILQSINDDLERRVFELLTKHIGEPITRSYIVSMLYGDFVSDWEVTNNPHDRAVRKCIENLRSRDYPIVSTSGEAGYCLTDDPRAIDQCVAEERSRIANTQRKIDHLLRSKNMAHDLHLWRQGAELPVQARIPGF